MINQVAMGDACHDVGPGAVDRAGDGCVGTATSIEDDASYDDGDGDQSDIYMQLHTHAPSAHPSTPPFIVTYTGK